MAIRKSISFDITIHNNQEELQEEDKMLMNAAVSARKRAYAP